MNIFIFTGVGPISSFSFFQPESLKQDEKKKKILDKSVDQAYKEEGFDNFDRTDALQTPYSDDDIEIAYVNKKRGDDVNFLNKFKRKTHQLQDQENLFNISLDPTRRLL